MIENTIEKLLQEFKENRSELKKLLDEIEKIKSKIENLFPEKLDNRYIRFFEEKVKSATEIFKTVLDIRKEIGKSLKEEIEVRRKLDSEKELDINIQELAEKIQSLRNYSK